MLGFRLGVGVRLFSVIRLCVVVLAIAALVRGRRSGRQEAAKLQIGQTIRVTAEEAPELKQGAETVGKVRQGQEFKVEKVHGVHCLVKSEIDGKTVQGSITAEGVEVTQRRRFSPSKGGLRFLFQRRRRLRRKS